MHVTIGGGTVTLHEVIGEGATGKVYRGVVDSTGQVVAVKLLREQLSDSGELISRYLREVHALHELKHPAFVRVFGHEQLPDGRVFIVMELVQGKTLADVVRAGKVLSIAEAIALFVPVCQAFDEARKMGIVHRDIKPENLLVEEGNGSRRLRVMDFGFVRFTNQELAEEHTALTAVGTSLGTPGFMPPEQLVRGDVDHRADIYALAASLYESVCGELPVAGRTSTTIVKAILESKLIPLTKKLPNDPLAPALWSVLQHALAGDREKRTSTAAEFAAALQGIAISRGATPVLEPPRERAPAAPPTTRGTVSPALLVVGLAALAGVGAGVAYWFTR